MKADARFTVNVTPETKQRIEERAKTEGRTLSGIVNRALDLYLRRPRKAA